jgi:hypothetical protein
MQTTTNDIADTDRRANRLASDRTLRNTRPTITSSSRSLQGVCRCCHRHGPVQRFCEGAETFHQCQPCTEARVIWSDTIGRWLTIGEMEAMMTRLVLRGEGFPSIQALVRQAFADKLIVF